VRDLDSDLLDEIGRSVSAATFALHELLDCHVELVPFEAWHAAIHVFFEVCLLFRGGRPVENDLEHFHAARFSSIDEKGIRGRGGLHKLVFL
jgi:hypothetical protein